MYVYLYCSPDTTCTNTYPHASLMAMKRRRPAFVCTAHCVPINLCYITQVTCVLVFPLSPCVCLTLCLPFSCVTLNSLPFPLLCTSVLLTPFLSLLLSSLPFLFSLLMSLHPPNPPPSLPFLCVCARRPAQMACLNRGLAGETETHRRTSPKWCGLSWLTLKTNTE